MRPDDSPTKERLNNQQHNDNENGFYQQYLKCVRMLVQIIICVNVDVAQGYIGAKYNLDDELLGQVNV